MRKLTLRCGHGSAHYSAAAAGISEVGMTKAFAKKAKEVAGDLDPEGRGIFGDGCFTAQLDESGYVLVNTWVETCRMMYLFTWPHLRLVSMRLTRCACPAPGK